MAEVSSLTLSIENVRKLFTMSGITYDEQEITQIIEKMSQKDFDRFCQKVDDLVMNLHDKIWNR